MNEKSKENQIEVRVARLEKATKKLENFINQAVFNLQNGQVTLAETIKDVSTEITGVLNDDIREQVKNEILAYKIEQDNKLDSIKYHLKTEIEKTNNDVGVLKERTLVLATDDGKMKELTKTMQRMAYQNNGQKNTLEYSLFHRQVVDDCYAHLYNIYQVNTYKRIKIEDFDEAIKAIVRWFKNEQNIKKSRKKKLDSLTDKQTKETITKQEEKLFNQYLNKMGGIF